MHRLLALAFVLLSAILCFGQDWPQGEVFGGYSYSAIDTRGITHRLGANGWQASASGNVNKWVGAEFDAAGHYTSINVFGTTVPIRQYSVLAGPRFTYRLPGLTFFAHGLFGLDRMSANVLGFGSGTDNAFASVVGGGVDVNFNRSLAIRLLQGDFVLSRHQETNGAGTQRNFRLAAGLVFRFGMRTEAPPAPVAAPLPPAAPISLPQIGVKGRSEPPYGLRITDVQPGSAAEQAGLRVGDILTAVDGRPVGTGEALAAELQQRQPGTRVSLRYLRQYWESDVTLTLGQGR